MADVVDIRDAHNERVLAEHLRGFAQFVRKEMHALAAAGVPLHQPPGAVAELIATDLKAKLSRGLQLIKAHRPLPGSNRENAAQGD